MQKAEVVAGVSAQIIWWMRERKKKLAQLRHESMSVNPFLLPLILGIHQFKTFDELVDFLVAAHLSGGYATGFGKLMDEKILPNVFGTIKLDKAARKNPVLKQAAFNEIDHVIVSADGSPCKLLSLKSGKWTIQLTAAVQLNTAFKKLLHLRDSGKLGEYAFSEITVGVIYGTKDTLTDKYAILRGINRGANHGVTDLTEHVSVYAGREFWAWLNGGEQRTQEWVLEGILLGFTTSEKTMGSFADLLANFRKEFSQQFQSFVREDHSIDWQSVIRKING